MALHPETADDPPCGELTVGRDFTTYTSAMDAGLARKLDDLRPAWSGLSGTAHVVDLGCGTGRVLSGVVDELVAAGVEVTATGVDCSPTLAATAADALGAAGRVVLADLTRLERVPELGQGSADVVLAASVLHEVFSYNGYDHQPVADVLAHCRRLLRPGGRLAVRDGVAPDRPARPVWLRLLHEADQAALRRFATDYRPTHARPGLALRHAPHRPPFELVRMTARAAFEFCSKKDYTDNWDAEVHEQFGVHTAAGWHAAVARAGFDQVRVTTYAHPWITDNRIDGRVLWYADVCGAPGRRIAFPATTAVTHAR